MPIIKKLETLYKDIDWKDFNREPVVPLGMDTPTNSLVGNLKDDFNLLIGGKSSSDKRTFLHCAMVNLLKNTKPDELGFILIDTKREDILKYNGLPNLLFPVITEVKKVGAVIEWCILEIYRRFQLLMDGGEIAYVYNEKFKGKMPGILIVISDSSGLMKEDIEYYNERLQKISDYSRLSGINIIIYSPKPLLHSKDLMDSFTRRVAFKTNSTEESLLLIGEDGATKLRGKGSMFFKSPSIEKPTYIKGFEVDNWVIEKLCDYLKNEK